MRSQTVDSQRACVCIVVEAACGTAVMWRHWRCARIRSTLPRLDECFATHGIQEGTVRAKVHDVVVPTGTIRFNRSPPLSASRRRTHSGSAVAIQLPVTAKWRVGYTLQIERPPNASRCLNGNRHTVAVQRQHLISDEVWRVSHACKLLTIHCLGQCNVCALAKHGKRSSILIVGVDRVCTAIVWCNGCRARICAALPHLYKRLITMNIEERTIATKVVDVVVPAGPVCFYRSPPLGAARGRPDARRAIAIKLPLSSELHFGHTN